MIIVKGDIRGILYNGSSLSKAKEILKSDKRGCVAQGGYSDATIYLDGKPYIEQAVEEELTPEQADRELRAAGIDVDGFVNRLLTKAKNVVAQAALKKENS